MDHNFQNPGNMMGGFWDVGQHIRTKMTPKFRPQSETVDFPLKFAIIYTVNNRLFTQVRIHINWIA